MSHREDAPLPSFEERALLHGGFDDGLRPVFLFFPGKSLRWIADTCRARRIPGAVKVGRTWMMRPSDFERWVASVRTPDRPPPPSVEEAAAELRRRGVL